MVNSGSVDPEEWTEACRNLKLSGKNLTQDDAKAINETSSEVKKVLHLLLNTEEKLASLRERQELLNNDKSPPKLGRESVHAGNHDPDCGPRRVHFRRAAGAALLEAPCFGHDGGFGDL